MSQAKQWKFQLVGGCDWQVGVVCGGGGSFQSSVTEDESSYGKAEFPLRLEISVCKAPGSPYLPKLIGVHSRLVIFSPGFRLNNDSWVCWTVLAHWCLSEILNLREKVNESSNAVFFLVFCMVESPVYSLVNRQHDYVPLLWSNHAREGGQQRCEYRACTTAHMLRLSKKFLSGRCMSYKLSVYSFVSFGAISKSTGFILLRNVTKSILLVSSLRLLYPPSSQSFIFIFKITYNLVFVLNCYVSASQTLHKHTPSGGLMIIAVSCAALHKYRHPSFVRWSNMSLHIIVGNIKTRERNH